MELIEREHQLRKLADAWNQVRIRKGHIALVSGEAGIGKTSLIERFVAGQRKSARVLWGACDDLFSPQPLGPFLDIALQLPSDLLQLIRPGADRLTISTQLFLHLQKNVTPTIIVLEDLHWADKATLDVVEFLGRRIQLAKVLLILSYRDDEMGNKHPLHFLLGDFSPHLITRIPVPRLPEEAVQHIAQRAGRQPEDLYTATGGNPFFVSEVIATEAADVPTSVRDAVLARVARLSPASKNIVELAALIPGAAEIWLIEGILHPEPAALDECIERGILHSKEDTLVFRHELARQAVEDSLLIGRTRELHGKILKALLSRKVDLAAHARLVHHATRAGDEEAVLRYAPVVARHASALGAHHEAAALYKTSLSLTRHIPAETETGLLEGLSFENYLVGDVTGAISPISALTALGHMKARQGDPEVTAILERARSLALSTAELQRIGPVAAARAEHAWWQGDRGRMAAEASPAYELALNRNAPWTLGQLAYWMWRAGREDIPIDRLAPPYALMIQGEWQAAAREWERIGCPFERALEEGDEPAKREALAIFEQLGAGPAAQDLRKKLQAQGVKNIPRETRTLGQDDSKDLTPRELEVLQLIAEGLSNSAIAEKLTVSVGTVKAHTANIYNKLSVKNRVQALCRSRELGLFEK